MQDELVLLHGWGMNQGVWQLIRPELEQEFNGPVKALDLPGYGNSTYCPQPYDFHQAAEHLSQQLQPNSVLMGWSLGGLFALYIAKHWPDKVAKVIMVAATPLFAEQPDWPGIKATVLAQFKEQLLQHREKTIERFLAIQAMGSETAREDIKQLKHLLDHYRPPQAEALSAGLAILQNIDLRNDFANSTVVIQGIFGRLDALVPEKAITEMVKLKDGFSYRIIEKASHAPFISHKKEFISAIKSMF